MTLPSEAINSCQEKTSSTRVGKGLRLFAAAAVVLMLPAGCGTNQRTARQTPTAGPTGSPSPRFKSEKLGQPFTYQQTFSNTPDVVDWEVTVTKVQCGIAVLQDAADNPAYTSGKWSSDNVPPERIDAKAPDGQTFCRMDATLKNVGKTPSSGAEDFDNLETNKGSFAASQDDDRIANNLLKLEKAPESPFNPGTTARVIRIWTVPQDARPVAVMFPGTTVFSGPTYRIEVD
jgi:hypothetical protein